MANVINNYAETEDGYSRPPMWDASGEGKSPLTPTLDALLGGAHVIYAMRLPDGIIKIGCTKALANRSFQLHGRILGFRPGDFEEEARIHKALRPHVARGREYYRPSPAVMALLGAEVCDGGGDGVSVGVVGDLGDDGHALTERMPKHWEARRLEVAREIDLLVERWLLADG